MTSLRRAAAAVLVPLLLLTVVAVVPSQAAGKVRVVTYAGQGRTVDLDSIGRLGETSPSFRRFVRVHLTRMWRASGGAPECRSSATAVVKRWRSDGFARFTNVGMFGSCPSGGAHLISVRRSGHWTAPQVLGGHEAPFCSDLRYYRVPRALGGLGHCYDDRGQFVRNAAYRLPRGFTTPAFAARTVAGAVNDGQPVAADRWARPGVVTRLFSMRNDGAHLSIGRCFGRQDPELGRYLGRAKRGCVLDALYDGGGYRSLSVLRLAHGPMKRWSGIGLRPYASS